MIRDWLQISSVCLITRLFTEMAWPEDGAQAHGQGSVDISSLSLHLVPTSKPLQSVSILQSIPIIVMRHLQPHSLVTAFDIEAFIRFGAVQDRLQRYETLAWCKH